MCIWESGDYLFFKYNMHCTSVGKVISDIKRREFSNFLCHLKIHLTYWRSRRETRLPLSSVHPPVSQEIYLFLWENLGMHICHDSRSRSFRRYNKPAGYEKNNNPRFYLWLYSVENRKTACTTRMAPAKTCIIHLYYFQFRSISASISITPFSPDFLLPFSFERSPSSSEIDHFGPEVEKRRLSAGSMRFEDSNPGWFTS